jgi:hypothetical protein
LSSGGIKPREAAVVLYDAIRSVGQFAPGKSGVTRETVYWRLSRDGWETVVWFTVTNYAAGLIRLRNDVVASVPKTVWPFALPSRPSFELTFHWSEVTEKLGEPLLAYGAASAEVNLSMGWKLFEEEQLYPRYAWTKKARLFARVN